MICRFFCSARLINSSACAEVDGEWLLHKNVLAVFQRALGQFEMRPDRSDDRDCVDVRGRQQFGTVGCERARPERLALRARRATSLLSQIATTFAESRPRRFRTIFGPQYP